jgi:hypothetical protein
MMDLKGRADVSLTPEERATLREHGLALFRGKLILKAQPPITAEQLAEVERRVGAPVPPGLRGLWDTAFGGKLNYDLEVSFDEHRYTAGFTELFYPESNGYRDLLGWIDYERELAAEAAEEDGEPAPDALSVLPFGGFEYLERIYVSLRPERNGEVVLWARGLPPAWKMRLNEDSASVIAPSLEDLFDGLSLDENPFAEGANRNLRGIQMAEAHDAVAEKHPELALKLRAIIEASVFDWRSVVSRAFEGTRLQWRAARKALAHATAKDDVSLLQSLLAAKVPVDGVVSGTATALSLAVAHKAHGVVAALLEAGVALGDAPIVFAESLPAALVEKLIERGVAFDVEAVLSLAESGELASARAVVARARRHGEFGDLAKLVSARAKRENETAKKVEARRMGSYLSAEEHRARAAALRVFLEALKKQR